MGPIKSVFLGGAIYSLLLVLSLASAGEMQPDGIYRENWLEGLSSLFAWFLPGLVSGSVVKEKPILAGFILGALVVLIEFLAAVLLYGWNWAVAGISVFPGAPLFFLFSAVVFTYAGWKMRNRRRADRS